MGESFAMLKRGGVCALVMRQIEQMTKPNGIILRRFFHIIFQFCLDAQEQQTPVPDWEQVFPLLPTIVKPKFNEGFECSRSAN